MPSISIHHGDNLDIMPSIPSSHINLIYTDPPFNTSRQQALKKTTTIRSAAGLEGFGGNRYERIRNKTSAQFEDTFEDYISFLVPRLEEAYRILKDDGSMYLHLDCREVHYIKVEMDKIFGRENFLGELIWSFDYGAISRKKWTMKHNNILYYVKDKSRYKFNFDKIPRIPYKSPKLAGPEKAARGKIVKSVWEETIVPTNSRERKDYPTQKPLRILNRIVDVSSDEGDICMDFFAGSGSFGEACKLKGRSCILIDSNPDAVEIMRKRLL